MKKYAALCVFVLSLIFSTQINAQEKINAKEVAIKKVEGLKQLMDLSNEQQQTLIDLYKEFESNKQKLTSESARDGVKALKLERDLQDKLDSKLQSVLSKKQYSIYHQNQKRLLYEKTKM